MALKLRKGLYESTSRNDPSLPGGQRLNESIQPLGQFDRGSPRIGEFRTSIASVTPFAVRLIELDSFGR